MEITNFLGCFDEITVDKYSALTEKDKKFLEEKKLNLNRRLGALREWYNRIQALIEAYPTPGVTLDDWGVSGNDKGAYSYFIFYPEKIRRKIVMMMADLLIRVDKDIVEYFEKAHDVNLGIKYNNTLAKAYFGISSDYSFQVTCWCVEIKKKNSTEKSIPIDLLPEDNDVNVYLSVDKILSTLPEHSFDKLSECLSLARFPYCGDRENPGKGYLVGRYWCNLEQDYEKGGYKMPLKIDYYRNGLLYLLVALGKFLATPDTPFPAGYDVKSGVFKGFEYKKRIPLTSAPDGYAFEAMLNGQVKIHFPSQQKLDEFVGFGNRLRKEYEKYDKR